MSTLKQRGMRNTAKDVHNDDNVDAHNTKREAQSSGGCFGQALRVLAVFVVFFFFSSYVITDSWLWGYEGKWSNPRQWIPRKELVFTEEELARYDGTDAALPIYIGIKGEVFDVTEGRAYYGPGGGYHFFAGRDAARAFITGCFETHLTHDLRGLGSQQLESLDSWIDFYKSSSKYYYVGRVLHRPIPPDAPIPPSCDNAAAQKP